jgi:hypothetical protein
MDAVLRRGRGEINGGRKPLGSVLICFLVATALALIGFAVSRNIAASHGTIGIPHHDMTKLGFMARTENIFVGHDAQTNRALGLPLFTAATSSSGMKLLTTPVMVACPVPPKTPDFASASILGPGKSPSEGGILTMSALMEKRMLCAGVVTEFLTMGLPSKRIPAALS